MGNYYPSIKELKLSKKNKDLLLPVIKEKQLIVPGMLARSDQLDVDDTLSHLRKLQEKTQSEQIAALLERTMSVSDLTEDLYNRFNKNPNSMYFWFSALKNAASKNTFFTIPETKIIRLPIELSQFMRLEYSEISQKNHDLFNEILFNAFELDEHKEYFIKTGTFSSKFEFQNAHVDDPKAIGEYFQVINNFAMMVGAGLTNDVVVREWIPNIENRPTIYDGMPLRTEFRAFIDCDTDTVIDIVPYWNPLVMRKVLKQIAQVQPSLNAEHDYETYLSEENVITNEFNQWANIIRKELLTVVQNLELTGKWSLDIMKTGDKFYLIDMATEETSALLDLADKKKIDENEKMRQELKNISIRDDWRF